MPMRKTPRNDDDDYDYDEEEIDSVSSDEEEEEEDNEEPHDTKPRMFTLRPPTPLLRRKQEETLWPKVNTVGVIPSINPMLENQSFSPPMQRPPINRNTYTTKTPTNSPVNRIKVRRKLPDLGPPQIVSIPSYQSPVYTSTDSLYKPPVQPPIISPIQPPSQVFPLQRISSNTLTNNESSPQTVYYPINRHSIENVT
jgi:hypothetical protein